MTTITDYVTFHAVIVIPRGCWIDDQGVAHGPPPSPTPSRPLLEDEVSDGASEARDINRCGNGEPPIDGVPMGGSGHKVPPDNPNFAHQYFLFQPKEIDPAPEETSGGRAMKITILKEILDCAQAAFDGN